MKLLLSEQEVKQMVRDHLLTLGYNVEVDDVQIKTSAHGSYEEQELVFDGIEVDVTGKKVP